MFVPLPTVEAYTRVVSESGSTDKKGYWIRKRKFKNKKQTETRKKTCKDIRAMKTKSNRKYIKNLSNLELTYDQINLLSWGLKFVATPIKNKTTLKKQLLTDLRDFARRMWLQYIYHGEDKNIHPFFIRTSSLLSFTFTPLHLGPFALNFSSIILKCSGTVFLVVVNFIVLSLRQSAVLNYTFPLLAVSGL